MTNSAKKLAALQNLWDVYRSTFASRSDIARRLDIADFFAKWAEQKRLAFKRDGAMGSFDDLCRYGCKKLPLAIVVGMKEPVRSFGEKWQKIMGPTRQREQKIKALEKAADALEEVLSSVVDVLTLDFVGSMNPESIKAIRRALITPDQNSLRPAIYSHVQDPAITISALRTYASILKYTTVTSPDMFARYLISAYVWRATGDFHDEEVSSLIAAGRDDVYDAQAHKMWRKRNYQRLNESLGSFADLLVDFGKVSG
ncbi:hypothetical protein [Tunturiibacter gelidoferens]|uniref:Uncharacterized protein n=1 Tax=Tunturiibacter gelidiferens TaxID=3069689 RepID=A0A9X0QDQ9_9BACT|nr:hypothetical protein [Edaphobacter lichenicola]MBB5328425.1 hypothetical protein [Edaphobacter lichenicola]